MKDELDRCQCETAHNLAFSFLDRIPLSFPLFLRVIDKSSEGVRIRLIYLWGEVVVGEVLRFV